MTRSLAGAANGAGTAPDAKVMSLVAGMLARADSIDDLDVLRHAVVSRAFGGIRAPSTLGTFLRPFTWGHARQLGSSVGAFTANRAGHCGPARTTPAGFGPAGLLSAYSLPSGGAGQTVAIVDAFDNPNAPRPGRTPPRGLSRPFDVRG
ncbi:hypothetical protein [Streptomyces sp. NPDC057580]|uniref:hypothetical protein n=1 Tax=Streptomyces sp. NPDC057580 TaxID=3346173 RepID=UPI00367B52A6